MAVATRIRLLFKKLADRYFKLGVSSVEQVASYVEEGILLPQDFKDITDLDYVDPNKDKDTDKKGTEATKDTSDSAKTDNSTNKSVDSATKQDESKPKDTQENTSSKADNSTDSNQADTPKEDTPKTDDKK